MAILTDLQKAPAVEAADQLYIVDTSDATDNPAGSSRRVPLSDLVRTVLVKQQIETISNPGTGAFNFTIPSGTKRVFIEGAVASNAAELSDTLVILYNNLTDETGHRRQNHSALNGDNNSIYVAGTGVVAVIPSANSVDPNPRYTVITVDNVGSGLTTHACGHFDVHRDTDNKFCGTIFNDSPITDEVTSIQISAGAGTQLSGTLTAYAELEIQVIALT